MVLVPFSTGSRGAMLVDGVGVLGCTPFFLTGCRSTYHHVGMYFYIQ